MAVQRGPLARIEVAGAWPLGEAELAREALQRQRRRHSPHSLSESRLDELGIPAPLCSRDERLRAPDKPQNGRVDGGWRCEQFRPRERRPLRARYCGESAARERAVVARARTRKTVIVVIRREAYPPIMATTAGENRQRRTIRPDERLIAVSSLPARASEEGTASSVDRSPAPESRNRRRRERAGARHPSRRSSLHRTPRPTRGRRRCTRGWSPSAAHREGVASAPSGRGHPPRSCKASQGRRRTLRGTRGRVDVRPPTPRPTLPTSRVAREGGWSKTSPRRHGRRSSGWLRTRAACRPGPRSAPGDSRRDTFVLTRVRGL